MAEVQGRVIGSIPVRQDQNQLTRSKGMAGDALSAQLFGVSVAAYLLTDYMEVCLSGLRCLGANEVG